MNSARTLSSDLPSSWSLCRFLFCLHVGKVLQKDASRTFFNEFGLISHQINSFDLPSDCSNLLSLGRVSVTRTGAGRYATTVYRKVRLDKPSF